MVVASIAYSGVSNNGKSRSAGNGGRRYRQLTAPRRNNALLCLHRGAPLLALPQAAEPWSLTSLREKLIKIGAKVVSHGRYVTFQMAEVAVPRQMLQEILSLIARLRAPPAPA
jgi:hypothetical protein